MKKLPLFDSEKHEFTYFATIAIKNAMAIQAMENRLNVMAEVINELIDREPNINLETFKGNFLKELAELLDQDSEFEFSNNLHDLLRTERTELTAENAILKLQLEALAARVSALETALGYEKPHETEKPNTFDLLG